MADDCCAKFSSSSSPQLSMRKWRRIRQHLTCCCACATARISRKQGVDEVMDNSAGSTMRTGWSGEMDQ
uniref:Uncharacterized protein n=1 Tax=Oryza nivara TaxID=4536 RepID=A0A0E0G146_ORYNI